MACFFASRSAKITCRLMSSCEEFERGRDHLLLDVRVCRTSTTDANADVVGGEILLCDSSHLFVESSREQEIAVIAVLIGI